VGIKIAIKSAGFRNFGKKKMSKGSKLGSILLEE
jgi:hypothetical protein